MRVRQLVREWAVELGFSLVDQTKIVTAASELARNTRRSTAAAGRPARGPARRRRAAGCGSTFEDKGPGIADIDAGAAGRLHHRRRPRPGPGRRQAPVERVRDHVRARAGHPRRASRGGSDACAPDRRRAPIAESSQVGEARRRRWRPGRGGSGFDETAGPSSPSWSPRPRTNLVKHARRRRAARCARRDGAAPASRCSRSTGAPGMATSTACLRDGYSTAGSPGTGLGAIGAWPPRFDVYSRPAGRHRASLARSVAAPAPPAHGRARDRRGQRAQAGRGRSAATPGRWQPTPRVSRRARGRRPRPRARRRRRGAGSRCGAFRDAPDAAAGGRRSQTLPSTRSARTRGAAVAVAAHRPRARRCCASPASATSRASCSAAATRQHLVSHNGTAGHGRGRIQRVHLSLADGRAAGHALRRARHPLDARPLPGPAARAPRADRRRAVPRLHRAAATT